MNKFEKRRDAVRRKLEELKNRKRDLPEGVVFDRICKAIDAYEQSLVVIDQDERLEILKEEVGNINSRSVIDQI